MGLLGAGATGHHAPWLLQKTIMSTQKQPPKGALRVGLLSSVTTTMVVTLNEFMSISVGSPKMNCLSHWTIQDSLENKVFC